MSLWAVVFIFISFFCCGVVECNQSSINLNDYLWKKRLLLIKNEDDEKKLKNQFKDLDGFKLRHLLILNVKGHQIFSSFPGSRFLLVGKDGGVKLNSKQVFSQERVFQIIDQMPMRKAEMQQQNEK